MQDTLYHNVFDGPTPGHPEEDAAERKVKELAEVADRAAGRVEAQERALHLMAQAEHETKACCAHIAKAEQVRGRRRHVRWPAAGASPLKSSVAVECSAGSTLAPLRV